VTHFTGSARFHAIRAPLNRIDRRGRLAVRGLYMFQSMMKTAAVSAIEAAATVYIIRSLIVLFCVLTAAKDFPRLQSQRTQPKRSAALKTAANGQAELT
jgi:hypothetical protein